MLTCGVKVTHDGGIALIDGNRLVLAVEVEKIDNNPRYSGLRDTAAIGQILRRFGCSASAIGRYVVDGWGALSPSEIAARPMHERHETEVEVRDEETPYVLRLARYSDHPPHRMIDEVSRFDGLRIEGKTYAYESTIHTAGHVLSAYCTSPFAVAQSDAYVLVWDGGIHPHLYHVEGKARRVHALGALFKLFGNAYASFARRFPPFHDANEHGLSTAGKVMAFIAQGSVQIPLLRYLKRATRECNTLRYDFPRKLARMADEKFRAEHFTPADFMATFHHFLETLLCATLDQAVANRGQGKPLLCIAGGCALNIKWNSAIRDLGTFRDVYVPPFPNDSGSAIGAACSAMFRDAPSPSLEWSVHAGPPLIETTSIPGWQRRLCSLRELAQILDREEEPVVLLQGRCELGPRALGGRSIVASARNRRMLSHLNEIKGREQFRPVAPICLEEEAGEIFEPGTSDRFMLFEHRVREPWRERIPAVVHIDGTARLQTVSVADNPVLHQLLLEYRALTGIPVLCNTSANHHGKGFFPSAASAAEWGGTRYIWSEGWLFSR